MLNEFDYVIYTDLHFALTFALTLHWPSLYIDLHFAEWIWLCNLHWPSLCIDLCIDLTLTFTLHWPSLCGLGVKLRMMLTNDDVMFQINSTDKTHLLPTLQRQVNLAEVLAPLIELLQCTQHLPVARDEATFAQAPPHLRLLEMHLEMGVMKRLVTIRHQEGVGVGQVEVKFLRTHVDLHQGKCKSFSLPWFTLHGIIIKVQRDTPSQASDHLCLIWK